VGFQVIIWENILSFKFSKRLNFILIVFNRSNEIVIQ